MRTTITCCGLAALAASPTLAAADVTNPETPNLLVILLDDVSVDAIGAYAPDFPTYVPINRPNTQAIDSLATAGVRFKRAWATPLCSSTRASIQTGLHPFRTGVGTAYGEDVIGLDPNAFLTLAQSFVANGYTTGLFGKHHLGTQNDALNVGWPGPGAFSDMPHPARMGWERFFGHLGGYPGPDPAVVDGYYNWERVSWLGGSGSGFADLENNGVHMTNRTIEVATSWINSRTEPWLAMVSLNAGHSGTTPSSTWTVADVNTDPTKYRTASLSCLTAVGGCGAATTRRAYQALVEHADIMIEEMLNSMDPATLDNTVIVFMGDNGTPFAAAEGTFQVAGRGKGSTYENGVRVPLIVAEGSAWRTGVPGTRIPVINRIADAKVHLLDTYNTLHELAFGALGTVPGLDSASYNDCLAVNDIYCGRGSRGYGYAETFPLSGVAVSNSTKIAVSYGYDTMVACFMPSSTAGAPATGCLQETFYDVETDPLQTAPLAWVGVRAQRLRDRFVALHTGTGSWAEPAGVVLPFCPVAVATLCP